MKSTLGVAGFAGWVVASAVVVVGVGGGILNGDEGGLIVSAGACLGCPNEKLGAGVAGVSSLVFPRLKRGGAAAAVPVALCLKILEVSSLFEVSAGLLGCPKKVLPEGGANSGVEGVETAGAGVGAGLEVGFLPGEAAAASSGLLGWPKRENAGWLEGVGGLKADEAAGLKSDVAAGSSCLIEACGASSALGLFKLKSDPVEEGAANALPDENKGGVAEDGVAGKLGAVVV